MSSLLRRWMIFGNAALVSLCLTVALAGCSHEPPSGEMAGPATVDGVQPDHGASASAMLQQAGELRGKAEPMAALSLLTEAHRRFPDDAAIASAYGRLALALGHDEMAAPLLDQAIAAAPEDWRALSAKGVLEARRGRLPDGRAALMQASRISASEIVIVNNLAISHLLDGKPGAAVSLLRQGLAMRDLRPSHERRLRRNLALALAMQGHFEEAETLAGEKLPRALASGDMSVLRRLVGVNPPVLAGATGWQAQIAEASRPARPAVR